MLVGSDDFEHEADLVAVEVHECVVEPAELKGQVLEDELGRAVDGLEAEGMAS